MEESSSDESPDTHAPSETRKSRSLHGMPERRSSLRRTSSAADAERRRSLTMLGVRWKDQEPPSFEEEVEPFTFEEEKSPEDAIEHEDLETASSRDLMRASAKTSLLAAVLVVVIVFFAAGLFSGSSHPHSYGVMMRRQWRTPAPRACGSESCSRLAALLAGAVNRSARPCDNFHDYVCGGWLQSRSVSVAQALRDTLINEVSHRARSMQVPDLHQTPSDKAARYFTACDDVVSASEDHLGEVKELLHKGGIAWPHVDAKTDLLDAVFYMSRVVRVPVVFELSLSGGTLEKIRISNTMAMFNAMTTRRQETKSKTRNFFRTLYESFSDEQASPPDLDRRFTAVVYQQKELFVSLNASLNSMTQRKTTTTEVHQWTKIVSKKRWQSAFLKYFRIFKNDSVPVVVDSKEYFSAVFMHYKKFGPQKTMDLYGYLCAQALFSFTNHKIIASYYASQRVAGQHRAHCFLQTDFFMHYAFQYSLFNDINTEPVRDDVTRLVTRLVHAVDEFLTSRRHFFGDCPAYANDKGALLDVFRRYQTSYVKEVYSSLPDMTNDPLANWMGAAEATSSVLDEKIPAGELMFGREVRTGDSPIDLAELDALWYALGAPHAVKLAGLGSRVTKTVFRSVLSAQEPCRTLEKSTDKLWNCVTATEPEAKHLAAVRRDVVVSLFSHRILWKVLQDSMADSGSKELADLPTLSEPELFFILACLPLCGDEHAAAKCNLALKHSSEFARVFSCRRGAPMRPKFQCSLKASRPQLGHQ